MALVNFMSMLLLCSLPVPFVSDSKQLLIPRCCYYSPGTTVGGACSEAVLFHV